MSINSALIDIRLPAASTATEPGNNVVAVIRRLAGRPRWLHGRPYLNVGDSCRILDARRGNERGSNWIHTHH